MTCSFECKFNPTRMRNLEQKTARLTVLIDPSKKKAFESLCAAQDVTPSQVVRRLIRDYLLEEVIERLPAAVDNVPAIVGEGKLPAGQVTASRNLVPAAIMVGVVGVTLLAMLLLLLVVLF